MCSMADHNQLGKEGEKIASDYLAEQGLEILESNFRFQKAEIDIIAKDQDELVFVEVKTRSSADFARPEEAVNLSKQKNILVAANAYLEQIDLALESRFDIISIVKKGRDFELKHLKNAFYPLL